MVDKSPRRIREMFDRITPTYDLLNHLLSLNTDAAWRRAAADLCPRGSRVLDVCCGTGDLAIEIARLRNGRVAGCDFAMRMMEAAAKKARGRIDLAQADATRLPFRDGAFDACTVAFGLRNVADGGRALAEMARVVRRGGRVIVLEFTLPKPGLVRRAYLAYFNHVLPGIGAAVSRDQAYKYLNRSVREWHTADKLAGLMRGVGLRDVAFAPLSFGIAAVHSGTK